MPSEHPGFRALPPYLGSKRCLCPLILSVIQQAMPLEHVPRTLLDPMCGSGAVALYAKMLGFHVIASDVAARGGIVARGLIANQDAKLSKRDVLELFDAPGDVSYPLPPEVAAVLTPAQARWFGHALAAAERCAEPRRSLRRLLLVKLLLRLCPLSLPSATDAQPAACGDYDAISPRRLGHYMRARGLLSPKFVWRIAQEINLGVFGGYGEARQADARMVIASTSADILYLDPPYPGTSRACTRSSTSSSATTRRRIPRRWTNCSRRRTTSHGSFSPTAGRRSPCPASSQPSNATAG